nr:hypothetical protein [Tanacetum cinerariifolium]
MKSACSKLDLIFNSAVADMKDDSILSNHWEILATLSVPLKAAVTPWSIITCSWALVTDVALIVSWSAVDLVVRFGAICF